jgi:hypothetical protein
MSLQGKGMELLQALYDARTTIPTGAATETKQDTQILSLASILSAIQAGISATVTGTIDAILQVGGSDISVSNPVPTTEVDTRFSGTWSAHRTAISTVDKITTPTLVTCADEVDQVDGAIGQTTSCKVAISAGTSFGPSGAGTGAAIITTVTATDGKATHSILVTVPQATGADSDTIYYLFISTDAAPKLLGTITEAQRAAGGAKLLASGTVLTNGNNAAGTVRLCALGTGDVTTATRFLAANSNAYKISGVTAIDSSTHRKHFITVMISQTGAQMNVQGAPSLTIIPFITDAAGNIGQGTPIIISIMLNVGQSKIQSYVLDINKAPGVRYLLNPSNCTATIRVEAQ